MENAALQIIKQAVVLDSNKKFTEAFTCYKEGIQLLLGSIKECKDEAKKKHFREKVEEYIERAERIKEILKNNEDLGLKHEQLKISDNAIGYSYESIFNKYLNNLISKVIVEDPYVRNVTQVYNFLRFCELLVKKCKQLRVIYLVTGKNKEDFTAQSENLSKIGESLRAHDVQLAVEFSETLHDRQIIFNTGWIVKIGRGLDIYKKTESRFSVGFCDFDLRPCFETTIDIYCETK